MHQIANRATGPILKSPRQQDKKHLIFVSTLPCVITGRTGVQVCHLRSSCLDLKKRHTGMREKPDDRFVLPMVPEMHEAAHPNSQHSMNELKFWRLHGWDWKEVVQLALDIHANSGDWTTCTRLIARARR